tara:strand:+ start:952 stop:1383 length:432 start_codon:yes stop_codon:yes gene_type:complete
MSVFQKDNRMPNYKVLVGECLCTQISWNMQGPFDFFGICQCSLCRKLTGSAFATNLFVKFEQFNWLSGEDNRLEFRMPKPSNFITSSCKNCGSRVPKVYGNSNKKVLIPYGSTMEIPEIQPTLVCYDDHTEWFTNLKNAINTK